MSVLSGGERARLALACMLLKPINFLVMDEPTNHLDMLSKDILKQAIQQFEGTLLVVSHDRDFLAGLTDRTMEFRNGKVTEYLGDINYFLNKRSVDNIREIEKRQLETKSDAATKIAAAAVAIPTLTAEEKKQLQRTVQRTERRISELEAEIKKMEAAMAEPDFYSRPDSQKQIEKYQAMQNELVAVMEEWEMSVEQLG